MSSNLPRYYYATYDTDVQQARKTVVRVRTPRCCVLLRHRVSTLQKRCALWLHKKLTVLLVDPLKHTVPVTGGHEKQSFEILNRTWIHLGPFWQKSKQKKRSREEPHTHKTPMTLTPVTDQWTPPTTSSPLSVCRLLALHGMWKLWQDQHPEIGQEVTIRVGLRAGKPHQLKG